MRLLWRPARHPEVAGCCLQVASENVESVLSTFQVLVAVHWTMSLGNVVFFLVYLPECYVLLCSHNKY